MVCFETGPRFMENNHNYFFAFVHVCEPIQASQGRRRPRPQTSQYFSKSDVLIPVPWRLVEPGLSQFRRNTRGLKHFQIGNIISAFILIDYRVSCHSVNLEAPILFFQSMLK